MFTVVAKNDPSQTRYIFEMFYLISYLQVIRVSTLEVTFFLNHIVHKTILFVLCPFAMHLMDTRRHQTNTPYQKDQLPV